MLQSIPRDQFLALTLVKSTTLGVRSMRRQVALALGAEQPAVVGHYLLLDGLAMILASLLSTFGADLKTGAEMIRAYWREWLELLGETEWEPERGEVFFGFARLADLSYRVFYGTRREILDAIGTLGELPATTGFVSMPLALRLLRNNARLAKLKLPDRFTRRPGQSDYQDWVAAVHRYRALVATRLTVEGRAPAPISTNMSVVSVREQPLPLDY